MGTLKTARTLRSLGTVKWFNAGKQYGFILADSGGEVFLHANDLNGVVVAEGDRVSYVMAQSKAQRFLATDVRLESQSAPVSAQVKWYDDNRGWGYATLCADGADGADGADITDVFIHRACFEGGLVTVSKGDALTMVVIKSDRGMKGVHIRIDRERSGEGGLT